MPTEELIDTIIRYGIKRKVESNHSKLLKLLKIEQKKLLKYKIFQKMIYVRLKS